MSITVISSFLASGYETSGDSMRVTDPGRHLIAPREERQRLLALGSPAMRLPSLAAVLSLMSDRPGPFPYRLACFFCGPRGNIEGGVQTRDFQWPAGKRFDRVTLRIEGQIPFFETGGVYAVRFLADGEPLANVPLPIFWEDELAAQRVESEID